MRFFREEPRSRRSSHRYEISAVDLWFGGSGLYSSCPLLLPAAPARCAVGGEDSRSGAFRRLPIADDGCRDRPVRLALSA